MLLKIENLVSEQMFMNLGSKFLLFDKTLTNTYLRNFDIFHNFHSNFMFFWCLFIFICFHNFFNLLLSVTCQRTWQVVCRVIHQVIQLTHEYNLQKRSQNTSSSSIHLIAVYVCFVYISFPNIKLSVHKTSQLLVRKIMINKTLMWHVHSFCCANAMTTICDLFFFF